ncbi:MAG: helix-turn-helix domain-containing protein [Pikeienuella sp.]
MPRQSEAKRQIDERFGERLKELRSDRGWSRAELGAAMWVSEDLVGKWETGKRGVNLAQLLHLAQVFSLTLDKLVHGDSPPPRIIPITRMKFTE